VPLDVLTSLPYNLNLGDSIFVKVQGINFYGEGLMSAGGNGATIVLVPAAPISLSNDASLTTATQIGFTWQNGPSTGGRDILSYRVWYDQSVGEYVVLEETVTEQYYTTSIDLMQGQTYKFKVQAKNDVGFSSLSSELSILAAQYPEAPTDISTYFTGTSVIIKWAAAYNGGTAITAYDIEIQHTDGVSYSPDMVNCDGSASLIVMEKQCTVPVSLLLDAPFDIPYGSSIFARVKAYNVIGSSEWSEAGNGALIVSVPSKPTNLQNVPEQTTGF
jgi:large repetitive protein